MRARAETLEVEGREGGFALGRLEDLAIWYAGWRGDARPRIEAPQVIVFAGNHGVTAKNVSPFPSDVTAQMVANFTNGGAAINQICAAHGGVCFIHMPEYPQAEVEKIELSEAFHRELNARLCLIYLGRSHNSSALHEQVIAGLEKKGNASNPLLRLLPSRPDRVHSVSSLRGPTITAIEHIKYRNQ